MYLIEFATNILLSLNFSLDLLRLLDELFLELFLEIVFRTFSDVEGSVNLSNHIRFFLRKANSLIQVPLTIVLPYSYSPFPFLFAYMAEFISLNTMKAWPRILIFFLAMI